MVNSIKSYQVNQVYHEEEPFKEAFNEKIEKEIAALEKEPESEPESFGKFILRLIMSIINYFLAPKPRKASSNKQQIEMLKKELATLESPATKADPEKIDSRRITVHFTPQLRPLQTVENSNQMAKIQEETPPTPSDSSLEEAVLKINSLLYGEPFKTNREEKPSIRIVSTIFSLTLQARALINITKEECIKAWTRFAAMMKSRPLGITETGENGRKESIDRGEKRTGKKKSPINLSEHEILPPTGESREEALKEVGIQKRGSISKQKGKRSYKSLTRYEFLQEDRSFFGGISNRKSKDEGEIKTDFRRSSKEEFIRSLTREDLSSSSSDEDEIKIHLRPSFESKKIGREST